MKTYTIRPLEWKMAAEDMLIADAFGEYMIRKRHGDKFNVVFENNLSFRAVGVAYTEAAAKELAWQDWLRRITPALEEVK